AQRRAWRWRARAPGPKSCRPIQRRRSTRARQFQSRGPDKSAGPVAPGRGSVVAGKVAVVTGAARGIGRAIAVELAANGADIVAVDIAGPVSPASNAVPASPEEL